MNLADIARRVIVTPGVIPRPAEHPQHVHTVFITTAVIRLIVVPEGIAQGLLVRYPVPVTLGILVSGPSPEVAVSDV